MSSSAKENSSEVAEILTGLMTNWFPKVEFCYSHATGVYSVFARGVKIARFHRHAWRRYTGVQDFYVDQQGFLLETLIDRPIPGLILMQIHEKMERLACEPRWEGVKNKSLFRRCWDRIVEHWNWWLELKENEWKERYLKGEGWEGLK